MRATFVLILMILLGAASLASAQNTIVTVRAKARDAKFIGTSIGAAMISIRDAETGELLARGKTEGSTGNTTKIMRTPVSRYGELSDDNTAAFRAELNLERPRFVTIEALAPYAHKDARVLASVQHWLIPGKNILGDGIVLEIPGFILDIISPRNHQGIALEALDNGMLNLTANMVMTCGCPISDGGLWDGSKMEVAVLIYREGKKVGSAPLGISDTTNAFRGSVRLQEPGAYELLIYGYDARTGNTAVDRVNIIVR